MTADLAHFERGVFGVVFHAFGKVLRNTVLALLVGIVLGEALGIALNPSLGFNPPTLFVHIVAGLLGLSLAFAVAMTTTLVEAIRAVLAATRAVGGEAKAVAETGAQDVGQDVGHVLTDLEQAVAHRDHDTASRGNDSASKSD